MALTEDREDLRGVSLHRLVACRAAGCRRRVDWREVRDRGLVVGLSVLVSVSAVGLEFGTARRTGGLLTAATGLVVLWTLAVLRRDCGPTPVRRAGIPSRAAVGHHLGARTLAGRARAAWKSRVV